MIKKVEFEDKVAMMDDEEIARKNKVTDEDINEIKEAINANADELTKTNTKLEGIDEGANKYILPQATQEVMGGIKVGDNLTIDADGKLNATDTTYEKATEEADGLMSKEDKAKLNYLENYDDTEIKQDIATNKTNIQANAKKIEDIQKEQTEQNKSINNKVNQADYNKAMLAIQAELNEAREENESIKGVIPTTSNIGENVTLNNTASMRFKKLDIGGNSKQETRVGYNLINNDDLEMFNSNKYISTAGGNEKGTIEVEANTKYSIIYLNNSIIMDLGFKEYDNANNATTINRTSYTNGNYRVSTFTTSNTTKSVSFYSGGESTFNTVEKYIQATKLMLVKGDFSTSAVVPEYEKYGAMPSLEFPSKVEAVGQDVNLFDEEQITLNRYVDSNGFDGASVISNISGYIPVVPNAEYTLNYDTDGRTRYVCFYNAEKQVIDGSTIKAYINQTITFKTTNDTRYIRFTYYSGATNVKLQKGTKATVWSPYNHGSANVTVCNKNFYTEENLQNALLDTNAGNTTVNNNWKTTDYICIPIDYFWVLWESASSFFQVRVGFYDIHKKFISATSVSQTNLYKYKFEKPAGCRFIKLSYSTQVNNTNAERKNIQIVKEDSTDYVERKEQTKTVPVQQEMLKDDGFVKIDGTWKEKHTWGKYVITGKEGVSKHTSTTNNSFYIQLSSYIDVLPKCPENNSTVAEILCSHFPVDAVNTNVFKDKIGIGLTQLSSSRTCALYISVGLDGISTSDEFKAKLAELYEVGTPVTVYYKLETPIYLDCTEAQKAVLNQIEKAKSYEDVTHIYSTDEISPVFDVEAYQDLKALFNQTNVAVLEGGN